MANKEHLRILKQGAEAWNEWRNENPSMRFNLSGADLDGTDLRGVNVEGAIVLASVFGNVDLCAVKGLEKVRHRGPSTIGIDTLYKSKGRMPKVFLQGCGVLDNFAYMASLVG